MNCKPGDLAIVVKSAAGNEGKIVRCERLASSLELKETLYNPNYPTWVIDQPLKTKFGFYRALAPDFFLRPIRNPGEDAKDQTLEWLPVPSKEKGTA